MVEENREIAKNCDSALTLRSAVESVECLVSVQLLRQCALLFGVF